MVRTPGVRACATRRRVQTFSVTCCHPAWVDWVLAPLRGVEGCRPTPAQELLASTA